MTLDPIPCRRLLALSLFALGLAAQTRPVPGTPADNYTPPTAKERTMWAVDSTVGLKSLLLVGPFSSAWNTAFNSPEEWGRTWEGFGRRYGNRLGTIAISNSVEAGFGAIWGEDPRYRTNNQGSFGQRVKRVLVQTPCTPYKSGEIHFAAARFIAYTGNNVLQNQWLPNSSNNFSSAMIRTSYGYLGRAGSNAFLEFWPDVKRMITKKKKTP